MKKSALALLIAIIQFLPLPGQDAAMPNYTKSYGEIVRSKYPLDQSLVNGFRYDITFSDQSGHPFLKTDQFMPGSLVLNGQEYSDVLLRHNIHNQQLELQYINHGGPNWIYLVMDFISSFTLEELIFQKLTISDLPGFYQIIETGNFTCYILWKKTRNITGVQVVYDYAKPVMFLANPDTKVRFKKNKQFAKSFKSENKTHKAIRKLLRKNSFSFRDASPAEIVANMHAVNSFLENNPETQ